MGTVLNWILIVVGALMILLEVLLGAITGFDFLLLGSAILLGGVLGILIKSAAVGIAAAGVLSLLYVGLGRRHIKSRLARHGIPSNVDALLGKEARVVQAISPGHPGRIKFEGEEWRAELDVVASGSIEVGHSVWVNRIDGVTAYVVPVREEGSEEESPRSEASRARRAQTEGNPGGPGT